MARENSVTLALNGEVSMRDFAEAMKRFTELIEALTSEIEGKDSQINWIITELEAGSARATATADTQNPSAALRIVKGFDIIGNELAQGEPVPRAPKTRRKAEAIIEIPRVG